MERGRCRKMNREYWQVKNATHTCGWHFSIESIFFSLHALDNKFFFEDVTIQQMEERKKKKKKRAQQNINRLRGAQKNTCEE